MREDTVLHINMFGGFSISGPGRTEPANHSKIITDSYGHSKKLWGLLEYLIIYRTRTISVDELYELLWSGEGSDDPMNALKILIHRARTELNKLEVYTGKELILHRHGAYQWNTNVPIVLDSEVFEKLYLDSRGQTGDERLQSVLRAISIYKGHFLPKSVSYQWVIPLDTYFHSKYIEMCMEAADLLEQAERYQDIVDTLRTAVVIDPYVEELHVSLIKALFQSGAHSAAIDHYKKTTERFYKQFGKTPSDELLAVYKELSKTVSEYESDVGVVREGLAEDEEPMGAFYCELEVFREICHLKARECARTGQVIHIALVTVVHAPGRRISQKGQTKVMDRLSEVIYGSLRTGDVYARYSLRQYIALIPSTTYENGEMIMDRIDRNFRNAYPKSGALLQCSLMPLEPHTSNGTANQWLDKDSSPVYRREQTNPAE